jgi:hypothetical protein
MKQHELIFISYARRDGTELARRLKADLETNGFDAWLDTSEIAGGAVWSLEIERELDHRQVTIALLSPGSYSSEICRAEQLRALDKGNRVLPVLAVKGADLPIYLYIRQYLDFTSEAEYAARFQVAAPSWMPAGSCAEISWVGFTGLRLWSEASAGLSPLLGISSGTFCDTASTAHGAASAVSSQNGSIAWE